jgi:hypothetical protein
MMYDTTTTTKITSKMECLGRKGRSVGVEKERRGHVDWIKAVIDPFDDQYRSVCGL